MAALEDFILGMLCDTPVTMQNGTRLAAFAPSGNVSNQNTQLRQLGLAIEVGPGRRGGAPVFDASRITVRVERGD